MQQKKSKKQQSFSSSEIGLRLKETRESRGITQTALAKRAGVSSQAVTQIEAGRRKPSFETLVALAQALDISLDALVGLPASKYPHDILKDAGVMALAEKIARMPPELKEEIKDYVDFVWEKRMRKKVGRKK